MEFKFKQFSIYHQDNVFKFGTDAALLATWVDMSKSKNVLEIGTGTGVITLMMAQRNPNGSYLGIDISKTAIELASKNLHKFPIDAEIKFKHSAIQAFSFEGKFDLIVSNPPFFEDSTKSPSELKNTTRHADTLPLRDLLSYSKDLLTPNGSINIIYPIRYLNNINSICNEMGLFPNHITTLRSTSQKAIKRVLISITCCPCSPITSELIINGNHKGYSNQVYNMLAPFLLNL